MHDDCIRCEDIARKLDAKALAALLVAFHADRWIFTGAMSGRTVEHFQITQGMGVTKKTATTLVRAGARWHNANGSWQIIFDHTLEADACHIAVGEALRDW